MKTPLFALFVLVLTFAAVLLQSLKQILTKRQVWRHALIDTAFEFVGQASTELTGQALLPAFACICLAAALLACWQGG